MVEPAEVVEPAEPVDTLLAAVEERFAVTGADTPPWPPPRPLGVSPAHEEYSRVLDPGKYRILGARARAWTDALLALGLAHVEPVADPAGLGLGEPGMPVDEAWWLRARRPGTLPVVVALRGIDGVPGTVVTLGAGEPPQLVELLPDCGCDACDDGSATLLESLDSRLLDLVTGVFMRVDGKRWHVQFSSDGWEGTGDAPEGLLLAQLREDVRDGVSDLPHLYGAPWLG